MYAHDVLHNILHNVRKLLQIYTAHKLYAMYWSTA